MLFRDILLIKKELHKFYDVNRADGPFVVAGKLFKSLEDANEKEDDEDSKPTDQGVESLLAAMKVKDEQLNAAEARMREITEERDAGVREIAALKKQLADLMQPEETSVSPPLPPGWLEEVDEAGRTYYYNTEGESTYDKPEEETLPEGWAEALDDEGHTYYYNSRSRGESTYERPR